jgi:hypothetical protein
MLIVSFSKKSAKIIQYRIGYFVSLLWLLEPTQI